jgi:hypothetical protein
LLAAGLIVTGLTFSGVCRAEPIKGEATFAAAGGFARLVFKLAEDVESEVSTAGSILIVRFKRPVDIPVEKLERNEFRLRRILRFRSSWRIPSA